MRTSWGQRKSEREREGMCVVSGYSGCVCLCACVLVRVNVSV